MFHNGSMLLSLRVKEYVQWLQLTAKGLRDALSLECTYGRPRGS